LGSEGGEESKRENQSFYDHTDGTLSTFFAVLDSRRVTKWLLQVGKQQHNPWLAQRYHIHVDRKRVYRLMKEMGIQARIRRKRKYYGHKEKIVVSENQLSRSSYLAD
jgi:transposase InsO family protein